MITIQIGQDKIEYTAFTTTAPTDYDSGGTISLADVGTIDNPMRLAITPTDNLAWQEGRNRSGLHSLEVHDDDSLENDVIRTLWQRLQS